MHSGKALDQTHNEATGQSLGALFTQLANLSSELVRDEFALAKHEIREKLKSLSFAILLSVIGALIGQAALLALCAAAALALAPRLGTWQAVLMVGGVLVLGAATLASIAVGRLKRLDLKPEQTLQTLEEDKQWLKELT